MTQLPSGAMVVAGDQNPRTGSSMSAHELKLSLKVHHREERHALSGADPGPAGFDFVLPDNDPALRALLSRGCGEFDERWQVNDC
ncbi:hypothetical protein SAMN05443247_00709 [Bradyrhizobium erythrophlei]|jgi:hypothetical protein|nr:hypothetical protein SAMN05443247_00709 [Bradyrhizobium erythrophlei]